LANTDLDNAKKNKVDEFYTQLTDIENELKHYKKQFKDKTIFCNCDDPYWSNFFYYFVAKFNEIGIKKLIATHYIDNDISLFNDIMPEKPYSLSITKAPQDLLSLERPAMVTHIIEENGGRHYLKEDGDFRSTECIEMLKEADIVVTNPPFSLFREYVDQIIEYNKKFLIIGNTNAITYKNIFRYIKENKMWTGMSTFNQGLHFVVPDNLPCQKIENGKRLVRVASVCWFTNLDTSKRHEDLTLYRKYMPEVYPKYDNYDAIEVSTFKDIPMDYYSPMGVPITFVDKYNPNQFEILGLTSGRNEFEAIPIKRYINPIQVNKNGTTTNGSKANTRATLLLKTKPDDIYYTADNVNGYLKILYARIIIKRILSKEL